MFQKVLNYSHSTSATFVTEIQQLDNYTLQSKIDLISQTITSISQSIHQVQYCIPSNNSKEELNKTITQYLQNQMNLDKKKQRLQQLQVDQQRFENQIAEYQMQRSPMVNQTQELQSIIEAELQRLQPFLQCSNDNINEIRSSDLYELISFRNPPQTLLKVLQATILLLKPTNQRDLEWQRITRDLREPQFLQQIRYLDVSSVSILRVNQAEVLVTDVTNEMVERQSRVGSILYNWIQAVSNFVQANRTVQPMRLQYQELQERLQQYIKQEENAQQQLIVNQQQQQVANVQIQEQLKWLQENNYQFIQCQFSEEAYKCLQSIEKYQNKLLKFMEIWLKMTSDDQIQVRFIDLILRLHPTILNQQTRLHGILSILQPLHRELIFTKEDQIKQQLQSLIDFQNDVNLKFRIVKTLPLIVAHTFQLLKKNVSDEVIRDTLFEQTHDIYSTIIQNNQLTHSIQYICGFISQVQLLLFKEFPPFPSYYFDLGNVILYDNLSIIDYLMRKVKQPQESSQLFQLAQFVDINQSSRIYKEYQLETFAKLMELQYQSKNNSKIEGLELIEQLTLDHKIQSHMKRINKLPQAKVNRSMLINELSNCQASIDDLQCQLAETDEKLEKLTLDIKQTQTKLIIAKDLGTLGFPIKRTDIGYISAIQIPSDTTYYICMQLMILIGKRMGQNTCKHQIVFQINCQYKV